MGERGKPIMDTSAMAAAQKRRRAREAAGLETDPYMVAVRNLNEAAYAAIRSCRDTTRYPMVNRHMLREIAAMTDKLVDAGPDQTAGEGS